MPIIGHLPQGHSLHFQTERVLRWHQRLVDLYSGTISEPSEMAIDEMIVFFIFCHQLKDWIIKETSIPPRKVEDYINNNRCLTLCADIANSIKHLGIDGDDDIENSRQRARLRRDGPRSGGDIRMRPAVILTPDYRPLPRLIITLNGIEYDVKDLADECILKWHEFLISHPPN